MLLRVTRCKLVYYAETPLHSAVGCVLRTIVYYRVNPYLHNVKNISMHSEVSWYILLWRLFLVC